MLNPFTEVNWKPGLAEKRKFAVSLIIGFPSLAAFFSLVNWLSGHPVKPFFLYLGGIGFAVGVVLWLLPALAKPFYLVWYFIASCMGFVIGNLLLSLFFFIIISPIGLLVRSLGRLSLRKGFDKQSSSYWCDAEKVVDLKRYYRQF
ncbi:MAG: hypothetical protein WCH43_08030 [Verrucomicrobiota bacterium]